MSTAPIKPHPSAGRESARPADAWRAAVVCGFLVVAILLVFGQTLRYGFLDLDDSTFVYNESHVSGGWSWSGMVWAFTNGPLGEWYPLSMLSHMLDCQLYGLNPAGHHFTNLLLHAASAVTLFLVLWRMTGALWPSALVAALFALHPLHVESVAWVAERRDVLSAFFFMLTLGVYCEYVRHPRSPWRYLAVIVLFALGLMAKQMLVTLPALLLLLDFWPLKRFGWTAPTIENRDARPASFPWRVIVDKLPLFALAIADAVATLLTHSGRPDPLTLPERLANAAVSCVAYLGQLFVPIGLSAFYSHPETGWPARQVAAAVALLLALTVGAVVGRRAYPYFFVGWFWYLGMLVPVLGLTYVGPHARADRYTYLSQIGLYIALVWRAKQIAASWPARRWAIGIGSAVLLAALMAVSWRQASFWQDDKTLWQHALACDPENVMAHCNLGVALEKSDAAGAAEQYRATLAIGKNRRHINDVAWAKAHNALGNIADRNGGTADAITHFRQALDLDANFTAAQINIGRVLEKQGKVAEALIHFQRAVELAPNSAIALFCLAVVQAQQEKTDDAIANFRLALLENPDFVDAHADLAILLAERNETDEAIAHYRRALEIDPNFAPAKRGLQELLKR